MLTIYWRLFGPVRLSRNDALKYATLLGDPLPHRMLPRIASRFAKLGVWWLIANVD